MWVTEDRISPIFRPNNQEFYFYMNIAYVINFGKVKHGSPKDLAKNEAKYEGIVYKVVFPMIIQHGCRNTKVTILRYLFS
jgi:hypothetical protein